MRAHLYQRTSILFEFFFLTFNRCSHSITLENVYAMAVLLKFESFAKISSFSTCFSNKKEREKRKKKEGGGERNPNTEGSSNVR